MTAIEEHPSLNHVYGAKINTPPTLVVFMRYYCKFVLLYKPLNVLKDTQVWIQLLVQHFADNNIKERGITVEKFTEVMKAFDADWDKDHVVDRNAALEARVDDDYTVDEKDGPVREMPSPEFDKVCLDFVREAIRYAPTEIIKFAQRYFKALEQDKVVKYLQKMADRSEKDRPQRLSTEDDLLRAQDYLAKQQGLGEAAADEMDKETTLKLIQRTLNAATEERKKRNAELRKQLDQEAAERKDEDETRQREIEAKLKAHDITIDTEAEKKLMASPKQARPEETMDMFSPVSEGGERSSFHQPTDSSLIERVLGDGSASPTRRASTDAGRASASGGGLAGFSDGRRASQDAGRTSMTEGRRASQDAGRSSMNAAAAEADPLRTSMNDSGRRASQDAGRTSMTEGRRASQDAGRTSVTEARRASITDTAGGSGGGGAAPEDEDPELAERIRKRKEAVARRQEEKRRAAMQEAGEEQ